MITILDRTVKRLSNHPAAMRPRRSKNSRLLFADTRWALSDGVLRRTGEQVDESKIARAPRSEFCERSAAKIVETKSFASMLAYRFPVECIVGNALRDGFDNLPNVIDHADELFIRARATGVRPARNGIAERSIFRRAGQKPYPHRSASRAAAGFRQRGRMPTMF